MMAEEISSGQCDLSMGTDGGGKGGGKIAKCGCWRTKKGGWGKKRPVHPQGQIGMGPTTPGQ